MTERDQRISEAVEKLSSMLAEAESSPEPNESSFELLLWKIAAEAEYLAFQISSAHGLGDYEPGLKGERSDSSNPFETARTILEDVRGSLKSNPRQSYVAARKLVAIMRSTYVGRYAPRKSRVILSPRNE